jgi:protein gp37
VTAETDIQRCDSSVNPVMGCQTCELSTPTRKTCYAGVLHLQHRGNKGYAKKFEAPEVFPGRMAKAAGWEDLTGLRRLEKPWLDGSPRLIFVSDMGDALSSTVPFHYLENEVIEQVMTPRGRRHRWLWLTKQPEQAAKFSKWLRGLHIAWPRNLWVGTSVTMKSKVGRVRHLLDVGDEHTVRFVSIEPQWEPVDLSAWLPKLDWVIQGGESGKIAKPFDLGWADDLRTGCRKAGTAYFLKQLGAHVVDKGKRLELEDGHGGDWTEWPVRLRVRQVPTLRGRFQVSEGDQREGLLGVDLKCSRIAPIQSPLDSTP